MPAAEFVAASHPYRARTIHDKAAAISALEMLLMSETFQIVTNEVTKVPLSSEKREREIHTPPDLSRMIALMRDRVGPRSCILAF